MIIVRNEFKAIVENIKQKNNYSVLEFYDGNKMEVEQVINSKDDENVKFNKYPCYVLEMPFTWKPSDFNNLDEISVSNLRLLIVTSAELEERNSKRYETKFSPILFPLLDQLVKEMNAYNQIQTFEVLKVIEHPYYGTKQTVSNDKWEVIEVILNIEFKRNC